MTYIVLKAPLNSNQPTVLIKSIVVSVTSTNSFANYHAHIAKLHEYFIFEDNFMSSHSFLYKS